MLAYRSPRSPDVLDFENSYVQALVFNAIGNMFIVWVRSTIRSDRIYIWDIGGEKPALRTECILPPVRCALLDYSLCSYSDHSLGSNRSECFNLTIDFAI